MVDQFQFLPEIPIDPGHTLDQLTSRFQTVRDGLPELVKNSKDQYSRLLVQSKADRQILVVLDSGRHNLAVLDFAGATSEEFDGWTTWSSRTAGRAGLSADIEAGHGNGGKAFMVRGSVATSFMESCASGRRTKMGFDNRNPSVRYLPGYALERGRAIQGILEANPAERLRESLRSLGLTINSLPGPCRTALTRRRAFTLVQMNRVKDWEGRRPNTLQRLLQVAVNDVAEHGQAALTVESCTIWVLVNGELLARPLEFSYPEPMEGFADLEPISLPDELHDPIGGDMVPTGVGPKFLKLRTSARQLRLSDDTRALNVVRVKDQRNVVGYWHAAELVPRASSAFVLGEAVVPSLTGEHMAGADRIGFADTPLVRAVRTWVADQIENLATQLERAMARGSRSRDRERANDALSQFRDLMREFLAPTTGGGDDDQGDLGRRSKDHLPPVVRWGTRVDRIDVEPKRDMVSVARGTTVPIIYKCYEVTDLGEMLPVRNPQLQMIADTPGILELVKSRNIKGVSEGDTIARLRDAVTGVESNEILFEVVGCQGADVMSPHRVLQQGERVRIPVSFIASGGLREDLMLEAFLPDENMGKVTREGWFTSGEKECLAELHVRFGPSVEFESIGFIEIGPDRAGPTAGDIPAILMCGSTAPRAEGLPPEHRTVVASEHYPTIYEDPVFPGVVWINPESKEAVQIRRSRGGSSGVGGVASRTFLQFLALKCFEVLKRLWVRQDIGGGTVTEPEFTLALATAEMECAGFIDSAFNVADRLYQGGLE